MMKLALGLAQKADAVEAVLPAKTSVSSLNRRIVPGISGCFPLFREVDDLFDFSLVENALKRFSVFSMPDMSARPRPRRRRRRDLLALE